MSELVSRTVISLGCLATVLVLALAGVVDAEVVTFALGALLPSPVAPARALAAKRPLVARKAPR